MPEPTIDEMLVYLKRDAGRYGWDSIRAGIISTLEGYRDAKALLPNVIAHKELEAIRAFVERVEQQLPQLELKTGESGTLIFMGILCRELAAMKKERDRVCHTQ